MEQRDATVRSVTIVVVTYNSARHLAPFFAALSGALDGVDATVVVSDNASTDASIDVAEELWPTAVIVESDTNRGYAAAINAAVRRAPASDPILVLNDDIRLSPGSVNRLIEATEQPAVGIAVPRLVDGDGRLLRSLRRDPSVSRAFGEALLGGDRAGMRKHLGEVVQDPDAYMARTTAAWASGCAWLISRPCWDAVGEWDESLFLYAEDIDYALRTRDAGFVTMLEPDVEVTHLVGPSHEDPRLWSMSVWNRYRVYRRRHSLFMSLLYRLALFVNEAIRCLAGRGVHCAGAAALMSKSKRPIEVR